MYQELEDQRNEAEANKKKNPFEIPDEYKQKKQRPPEVYNKDGEIRQCNQGDYPFKFWEDDDKDLVFLEVKVPKYLSTQHIDADVNPEYVRIDIKGKITQLKWP